MKSRNTEKIVNEICSGKVLFYPNFLLTPEIAGELKKRNTKNRPLSRAHVAKIADAIRVGKFPLTGEPIIIGKSGDVLDGQHRIYAVDEAGIPLYVDIRTNINDDYFKYLGRNKKRSGGDVLGIAGVQNYNLIAASLRYLVAYDMGLPSGLQKEATPEAILSAYYMNPSIENSLTWGRKTKRAFKNASPAMFCFIHYMASNIDPDHADVFFTKVVTAIGIKSDRDPALALRKRLDKNSQSVSMMSRKEMLAICIKAWNFSREKKRCSTIKWNASEKFPTFK